MARIVKASNAPDDLSAVTLGQLTLEADQLPFDTDDASVLAAARGNRFVEIEEEQAEASQTAAAAVDPYDPHRNPEADHLSAFASASAIKAAEANERAIREVASPYQNIATGEAPTTEESVKSTFENVGVEDAPSFPDAEAPAETTDKPQAPEEAAGDHVTPDEQAPVPSTPWSNN